MPPSPSDTLSVSTLRLPASSMPITVKLQHCDPRVVSEAYMACDSFTWYALAHYDWVVGRRNYVHVRHFRNKTFHRLAFAILNPSVRLHSNLLVDHKNKQRLDCRASNLRATDHRGNCQNRSKRRGRSSSRFLHVHRCPSGTWRAEVQTTDDAGVRHRKVSYHRDEVAAAKQADAFAKMLHGDMASLNFPPGGGSS